MVWRAWSVLWAALRAPVWARRAGGAKLILARNLEMLVLARILNLFFARSAKTAYEVLDIHRLMTKASLPGRALRRLERWMMRGSRLVVSSPAFLSNYFDRWGYEKGPILLLENKVFAPATATTRPRTAAKAPPWRIGWYGVIRCRQSLQILTDLCRHAPGLVEVEIRGRPFYAELPDLQAQVDATPSMTFHGPYEPGDLPSLYSDVHFAWAIDHYEDGLNSAWLLPNRLYESQFYGAVPIAEQDVETGAWLRERGAGLLLRDPAKELLPTLSALTPERYRKLARETAAIPQKDLLFTEADCVGLVNTLTGVAA
jgi:succinoglycan biosynthesis protein ExoL